MFCMRARERGVPGSLGAVRKGKPRFVVWTNSTDGGPRWTRTTYLRGKRASTLRLNLT
jgi:hypothetical protein